MGRGTGSGEALGKGAQERLEEAMAGATLEKWLSHQLHIRWDRKESLELGSWGTPHHVMSCVISGVDSGQAGVGLNPPLPQSSWDLTSLPQFCHLKDGSGSGGQRASPWMGLGVEPGTRGGLTHACCDFRCQNLFRTVPMVGEDG